MIFFQRTLLLFLTFSRDCFEKHKGHFMPDGQNGEGDMFARDWHLIEYLVKLGASKEARDDTNILKTTIGTDCIIVTTDKGFVERLKASDIMVVTIEPKDKANIIDIKLKELV